MLPYFNKILCPTDFSPPSLEAVKIANDLAGEFGSELFLVYVLSPLPTLPGPSKSPSGVDGSAYQDQLENSARNSLQDLVESRISQGVEVRQIVGTGNPAEEIVHIAEKNDIGLVVIATRGQSGLKHFFFGSVAEKVMRLSPVPVLSVRGKRKEK